jgi:hypothetical protein
VDVYVERKRWGSELRMVRNDTVIKRSERNLRLSTEFGGPAGFRMAAETIGLKK